MTTTTSVCLFPGCDRPAATTGASTGRPSGFCDDPGHNAGAAYRARKSEPAAPAESPDQPVTAAVARAGGLRDELVKLSADLVSRLTQVGVEFESMTDPDKAAVEIEAVELQAAEALAAERVARSAAQEAQRSAVDARIKAHGERDEARAAADEFEAELDAANVVHADDVQALEAVREQLVAATVKGEALTADLSAEAEERGAQSARADDLEVQLTEAREQAVDAQTSATRLQAQLEAVTVRADEAKAHVAAADDARVESDRNRVAAETSAARLEAQLAGAQGRVVDLERERTELTAATLAATERAARAEARVETAAKAATDTKPAGPRPGPSRTD